MIEETDQELLKVLDCTIDDNGSLKEKLRVTNEIIRICEFAVDTYQALLTQKEKYW